MVKFIGKVGTYTSYGGMPKKVTMDPTSQVDTMDGTFNDVIKMQKLRYIKSSKKATSICCMNIAPKSIIQGVEEGKEVILVVVKLVVMHDNVDLPLLICCRYSGRSNLILGAVTI